MFGSSNCSSVFEQKPAFSGLGCTNPSGPFRSSYQPAFSGLGCTNPPGPFGSSYQQSQPCFGTPYQQSQPGFWSSPAFGQSTSACSSSPFGTATSAFGTQSYPFGAQATTPTFGSPGFGQSSFGGQRGGSRVTPYSQTPEAYNANCTQASGKLESISAMHTYREKSHEELRWEDYQMGDKGGSNPAGPSFGGMGFNTNNTHENPFYWLPAFSQPANLFSSTTSTNPFAPNTSTFSTPGFGSSIPAKPTYKEKSYEEHRWEDYQRGHKGSSVFGQKPAFGSFGSSFQQSQPAFGSSVFGSSPFGASSQPAFGATRTSTFGSTSTPPTFGNKGSAFGVYSSSHFGSNTPPSNLGKVEEANEYTKRQESYAYITYITERLERLNLESVIPLADTIHGLLTRKAAGNEAYKAGKYEDAVEHYTSALSCSLESRPFAAICYCNRAAAYKALGQVVDAIADCSLAIALDPTYHKAISRRASLYEMIRDYGLASIDLRRLVSLLTTSQMDEKGLLSDKASVVNELRKTQLWLNNVEKESRKKIPLNMYLILGVKSTAAASEIKKAYRKAALKHHPDKAAQSVKSDNGMWKEIAENVYKDADTFFKLIGEAYAILSNPSKRSRYDMDEKMRNEVNKYNGRSSSGKMATNVQSPTVFERSGSSRWRENSSSSYRYTWYS